MFEEVGLEIPANVLEIVEESVNCVAYRATAPYAGIIDVISDLYEKYGTLHTASNEDSIILNLYLSGMGVREKFKHLFGTDLVNIKKFRQYTMREYLRSQDLIQKNVFSSMTNQN